MCKRLLRECHHGGQGRKQAWVEWEVELWRILTEASAYQPRNLEGPVNLDGPSDFFKLGWGNWTFIAPHQPVIGCGLFRERVWPWSRCLFLWDDFWKWAAEGCLLGESAAAGINLWDLKGDWVAIRSSCNSLGGLSSCVYLAEMQRCTGISGFSSGFSMPLLTSVLSLSSTDHSCLCTHCAFCIFLSLSL